MKRIITLLAVALTANLSISQVVFQSDLSAWDTVGNPTDFFGGRTSISAASVTEVTTGAIHGTSFANIINSGSGHKRLTTQAITVVPGSTYIIEMWIAGTAADLRVNYYDLTNSSYGTYTSYQTVSGTALTKYTDSIVAPVGCTSIEYIISLRNTAALGIGLDSVSISGVVGPPAPALTYTARTIYEIQYTAAASGDSPFEDSLVETTGIVTGTGNSGYFIQDSSAGWNGVYVYDNVNTPARGDEVTIKGKVVEFFDLTEITNVDTMIVVSTGNTVPAASAVTTSSIASEMWEGVLVQVTTVICVDSNAGFGEWDVANTGMDTLPVDDLLFAYVPVQYQGYDVTGIVHYSFNEYKLEPRDSMDIVQSLLISISEENEELQFSIYPNPVNEMFTISGVNLERAEIYTSTGKLVKSISLNTINTIDVSELSNGVYVVRVISGENTGVSRFVKQ
ncbi:T9SS type A sorting domain-containing protein [Flavobacteriales bacterium]|nr:T9SS type A sorting domain-containing protein [Flavobacteriales bacterium]